MQDNSEMLVGQIGLDGAVITNKEYYDKYVAPLNLKK